MRKIYYVPEGQDILDYQDIWLNHTQEVHNSLSENIKEYVKDKDVAQWVLIPEYTYPEVPKLINNEEFYEYLFIDDFAVLEDNPQYVMEAWKLNLDNPKEEPIMYESYNMQWEKVLYKYFTDHIQLPRGWYKLKFIKDGELVDSVDISVYEKHQDDTTIYHKRGR